MRILLGVIAIGTFLLLPALSFAQATSDWSAVTSITPALLVRVTGTRAGVRQRLRGPLHFVDATHITVLTNTSQGAASFDRQNVQRVELIVGDALARQHAMVKGGLIGMGVAILGTVSSAWTGDNTPKAMVALYSVTIGGGVALGTLNSRGKGAKYVRIYERP